MIDVKKAPFIALTFMAFTCYQPIEAVNFSVDNSNSSGPGSFHDVIKSANALFPGEGEFHRIYFREPIFVSEAPSIIRQNLDLNVFENCTLTIQASLVATSRIIKSGLGSCIIDSSINISGPIEIQEGALQLNAMASNVSSYVCSGKLILKDPSFVNNASVELKEQGRLSIQNGGIFNSDFRVDQFSFISVDTGHLAARSLAGSGTLLKQGQGLTSFEDLRNFSGNIKIQEGILEIKKGYSPSSLYCEGGEIRIQNDDAVQNYKLYLSKGKLDLLSPMIQFSHAINLAGSDAVVELNQNKAYLKQGFKGWGVIDINGPGQMVMIQQEPVCAHFNFNTVDLETNQLSPRSVYIFKDSSLKLTADSVIDPRTDLMVDKTHLVIDHGKNHLDILGRIKGNGSIEVRGSGKVTLRSVDKIVCSWLQNEGTLLVSSDINQLKIGKNADLFGIVKTKDLDMQGIWHYQLDPENLQPVSESKQAKITGTIIIEPQKGTYSTRSFSILKANKLDTTGIQVLAPAQFDGRLVNHHDGLSYQIKKIHKIDENVVLKNADNQSLANHLNQFYAQPGSEIDQVIRGLLSLQANPSQFLDALSGLQPAYFSALGLVQESNFVLARSSLSNRMQELISFPCARQYVSEKEFAFWIDPVGDFTQQEPRQQDMGYHASTIGGFMGFDGKIHKNVRFGFSLGYTNSDVDWMKHVGNGTINSVYSSLYFLYKPSNFYLNGSLAGAYSYYDASRRIQVLDVKKTAKHNNHGLGYSADFELGYVINGRTATQPFLRTSYINLFQNSFTEAHAGDLNLHVDQKRFSMYRIEGGFVFNRCLDQKNWTVTPEVSLSGIYEQELNAGNFNAVYINTQESLTVFGMKPKRLLFSPGAALDFCFKKYSLMLGARYHAELCPQFYDQRISGHIAHSF